MKNLNSRIILPVLTMSAGILWFVMGVFVYTWWSDKGPGNGFFPAIAGLILAGISILAIKSERKEEKPHYIFAHIYPLLAVAGILILAMLIGFFPSLAIYMFCWLKMYEKYSIRFSLLVCFITTASMFGVFYLWLRVPFPQGLILNLITG